ncbi:helix-turn-helix domain-containing protein [Nonomuraea sp. NPDC050790]|uniref:AraC family transcriptional regulator n=1 Tax=Nonomuraea sp. NPDC050790 TaxID=3364371 RepID=UPI00379CD50B
MDDLTMVERVPGPALRPYVTGLYAYRERYARPHVRLEAAMPGAVLILGFGAPMEVDGSRFTSFTGGLSDRYTVTTTQAPTEGVEALLTPFGARRLYRVPMRELTNLVVPADDLLAGWAERLGQVAGWHERLARFETMLTTRILGGPEPRGEVGWAWARLLESGGSVSAAALSEELGWSHRHLVARFHEEIGLAPKAAARLIRFERARNLLRSGVPPAQAAAACGYYDQAHMNRDFRLFCGETPGQIFPRPPVAAPADSAV